VRILIGLVMMVTSAFAFKYTLGRMLRGLVGLVVATGTLAIAGFLLISSLWRFLKDQRDRRRANARP